MSTAQAAQSAPKKTEAEKGRETKQANEEALLAEAIQKAEEGVQALEAEDQALLEPSGDDDSEAEKTEKKAPKAEDSDEEVAAKDDEDEEPDAEELKTRVFLKAKQRAQRERAAIEEERLRLKQEKESFIQESSRFKSEAEQIVALKQRIDRLFKGDETAAFELAEGRDLTQMWHGLAAASDPNRRGQFQQKKEQSELEKQVAELKNIILGQQQQQQMQTLAQREAELENMAVESLSDPEAFPAIHKRYNLKNNWEKEELLVRYKSAAEEIHAETGETPNHPSFFQKVSKRLEKKLRSLYLTGDSSKSSEPDASPGKSGQKPTSISASKLSARDSARKAVRDMTDEEKLAYAIEEAEAAIRASEAEDD